MDIQVRHVAKEFTRFPALHGVDLDIRSGELLALLGPSGSGKTTLLRILAGLETPTKGTVFFGEEDASRTSVRERRVGFVFQHYALFKHMTVFENIAFGLRVRSRSARPAEADIRRRVLDLLDLVQLPGLDGRHPAQLSGGQRQRVALARALAVEPRVLLLDEPFGALDAKVRKDLRRWLREIHDKTGYTTIFVTHDQEEALELADRVVILNKGCVEQVGTPDEVYDAPATPFVADFIGGANMIPVRFSGGRVMHGAATVAQDGAHQEGEGILCVRPREVELTGAERSDLTVLVRDVRRSGVTRRVDCVTEATGERVEAEVAGDLPIVPGARLGASFRAWRAFAVPAAA
jgi:sulfate/thiosulfate transport system ATP-binding protein